MPTFSRLELENFKSYRSRTTIQWKQVSSILGQNGTGKSTIIDAVEYVFCFPRYNKKSVQSLRNVLYNKNSGDDEHSSTWVSATVNVDNKERKFKRSVNYNESVHKYWVDNRVVELNEYKKSLLKININPKANNFLVQQNSIESLALKDAKQRSEFFEILSNSITHKPEYNSLMSEMKSLQSEVNTLTRIIEFRNKEKRNLIQKSNEIKIYAELTQQLEQVEFNYYYIKLYEIKNIIDRLLEQEQEKQQFILPAEKLVIEYKKSIDELKNNITEKENEITVFETNLENHEAEISDYKRTGMELTEKIKYCENEIEKVNKNLETAKNVNNAHEKILHNLEKQLSETKQQKKELDESSQSCSLDLDDKQYEEYLRLKTEVQKRFAEEKRLQKVSTLERECNVTKDKINEYKNKTYMLSDQIEREKLHLNEIIFQKENVQQKINDTEAKIRNTEEKYSKLNEEINNLHKEVQDAINKIEDFNKQLSDYDIVQQETSSNRRLSEIIDTLKIQFHPRVLGRLSDLCKVTDNKYEIAITKILGHKMDGIVVDTTNTATECIEFLKEQYRGDRYSALGTFFPLDQFQDKYVTEDNSRAIEKVSYAKLAINVMSTGQIDNILTNLLRNIVICETDEQAMELSHRRKFNCVSLDGTYFKKDGTFSGGYCDTRKKAKQWNEKKYKEIEARKHEKTEIFRNAQQQIREKEICLQNSKMKLKSLWLRLNDYLKPELEKCNKNLEMKKTFLQELENNFISFKSSSEINELQESLKNTNIQLADCKQQEDKIEDEVFLHFCEKFQLKNIRKYEESDVRKHEERLQNRMNIDNHLSKIKNQLKYEKSRKTKATIITLEDKLSKLKGEHKQLLKEKGRWKKHTNEDTVDKDKIKSIRCDIETIKKDLNFKERAFQIAKNDLKASKKSVAILNSKIKQLQHMEIHQLLTKCKVKGIDIPLKKGTIKKVVVRTRILDTESEDSSHQVESDSAILEKNVEIDFSQLDKSIQNLEESELNNHIKYLANQRKELKVKLESCIPSNRNMKSDLESLEKKIKEAKKDLKTKQREFKTIKENFEEVKNKRKELFINFCSSVEKEIDGIFKSLYNDTAAQACIIMVNPDEPYLEGISLSFLIPTKRFSMIENLSGGEKTMCAMALFLAIYNAKPAPCIIFDEIDAALDNINLQNVVDLFLKWKRTTQIISISHHECLFRCADAAIGVNISTRRNSSYAIHVDLTRYLQPVDMSLSNLPTHRTVRGSENRSTGVILPSLSSSSRRSTIYAPQHASTPSSIIVKSVELLPRKEVTRKRKVNRSEKDDS